MTNLIENTITETLDIINANKSEWEDRYDKYAELMFKNKKNIVEQRKNVYEREPLYYYINTTQAKEAVKGLGLDIRYRGQSIATLKIKNSGVTVSTKNKEKTNRKHFDCEVILDDVEWTSSDAQKFRSHFKNRKNSRNDVGSSKNEEHNVESLLLTELLKTSSANKPILNIQPVTFCGIRYAMSTPLKASKKDDLGYSKVSRGGIDILARTKEANSTYITVIEVKDESKASEPPQVALNQAIRYAVFIRELLRSKSGAEWYKLFGFNGNLPEKLIIRVVCAMPDDIEDKTFANKIYPIANDYIECHYIYFKYDGKRLSEFQTSLPQ